MLECVTNRVAEWKRRFKENQMLKKIMANDVEAEEDDNEDEDEYHTREDIQAIEGANTTTIERPVDPKKIKATKNYTYPSIAFCNKCMHDVSTCTCILSNSQSSQKLIEKLMKHHTVSTTSKTPAH